MDPSRRTRPEERRVGWSEPSDAVASVPATSHELRTRGLVPGDVSFRTRDVVGFIAFSHGWTWGFWALAGWSPGTVWDWPGVAFFYLGGVGVPLGAVVMAGRVYGRPGVWDLGRRLMDPRRVGAGWWAVILLTVPVLTLAAALLAAAAGMSVQPLELGAAGARLLRPGELLAFAFFILLIGPLPEEIGWRGYLLDRMQLRWTALGASLLLALIWWSWHLPLYVLPGYFEAFDRAAPSPWSQLAGLIPSAILYTWVYNNCDRSILAVVAFHFMQNFTGQFLGLDPAVRPVRLGLEVALAAGVIAWWGPITLTRRRGMTTREGNP